LRWTAVAELIRTAWRFAPRGKNNVAPSEYPSVAGSVISSTNTSSSPGSATAVSPSGFESGHSKCEFGFCRKGLTKLQEIWLAVRRHPVYNPALH